MNLKTENKTGLLLLGGFFFCVIIYGFWEYFVRQNVHENGVYTKATVEEVFGYKGGVRIDIAYSFDGSSYSTTINYSGDKIGKSDQILIKLSPNNPKAITLEKDNISNCLKNLKVPNNGWTKAPICN